jgi:hypothetical protein
MAQPQRLDRDRTWLIISLVVFIGYIPLLGWLPYQFAVPAEVSSAASAAGYSGRAATWIMGVWTLCGMVGAAVVAWLRRARGASPTSDPGGRAPSESEGPDGAGAETEQLAVPDRRTRLLEVLIVAIVVGLMYFPLFLAQYGPYIEDNIFLNALHRMGSGQQPFVDFEFLYGPLMIQAAWLWTKLFGYSMVSFYAYLALLEVLLFGVLTLILHRNVGIDTSLFCCSPRSSSTPFWA